tara:strand:- start:2060 stop:2167 length:108 start_codon:yes stop_codon:yes gene_type:complete
MEIVGIIAIVLLAVLVDSNNNNISKMKEIIKGNEK